MMRLFFYKYIYRAYYKHRNLLQFMLYAPSIVWAFHIFSINSPDNNFIPDLPAQTIAADRYAKSQRRLIIVRKNPICFPYLWLQD